MREKIIYFHPREGNETEQTFTKKTQSPSARRVIEPIFKAKSMSSTRRGSAKATEHFVIPSSASLLILFHLLFTLFTTVVFFSFFGLLRFIPAAMIKKERKKKMIKW